MTDSITRGKYVICGVSDSGRAEVISDGAIYQRDGLIAEVGDYEDIAARHSSAEMIGSANSLVLPGLVNAHHHVGLTPFQLGAPDYPLELWIARRLADRKVDPYLDTLYSAFEMISSGITTVQHLHGLMWSDGDEWGHAADEVLRAYRDIGMRVSFSIGIFDQDRLVLEEEAFLRTLPHELRNDVVALGGPHKLSISEQLDCAFHQVLERWGGNTAERVRVQLMPQNLHWCSDDALLAIQECADTHRVGLHMHLLESQYQKAYAFRRTGKSAVAHLADLGLLGPHLTLGHAVWVTDTDLRYIAETGTMVCHNASSNLRLRSGIAPVNQFLERNVRVAIGIDEAGINDDRDMLQEMRVVMNIHRTPGLRERVPTAAEVLRMATENAALTTGFGNLIGVLAPGKAADLVVLDWSGIAKPYLDEGVPIVDALVYRGRMADVRTVMVGGELILQNGAFPRVDRDAVLTELANRMARPLSREEKRRGALASALTPRVADYLEGWGVSENAAPYYSVNSRT